MSSLLEESVRKGELEETLITFQMEIVKPSPEEIARMNPRPMWAGMIASMTAQARQTRALYRLLSG